MSSTSTLPLFKIARPLWVRKLLRPLDRPTDVPTGSHPKQICASARRGGQNDPKKPQTRSSFLARMMLWHQRSVERRRLRELSPDQLFDIGVNEKDARREASRWPWDGNVRTL